MRSLPLPSATFFSSFLRSSSYAFLQLIDTFVEEIGELKKEMVQTSPTADKELMDLQG